MKGRSFVGSDSLLAFGSRFATAVTLLAVAVALAAPAYAGISVGAGSSWVAADAHYDLGCGDLGNLGEMDLGTATFVAIRNFSNSSSMTATAASVTVGGDWSNTGTFSAGDSEFHFVDDCGDGSSTISGETTFPTLSITSSSGKEYHFAAGATQTVTNSLTLQGVSGTLLVLRSTEDGTQASIDLTAGASQNIQYVDVADHAAVGKILAPGPPAQFASIDAGNNSRWFAGLSNIAPVPAMSTLAIFLAYAAFMVIAWTRHRAQQTARLP